MENQKDQKKIIGENIKTARKLKGLSQRALAEQLGIAFQNLSVWENGKGAPSAKYLMKLAEILDISLDQLTSPEGITMVEGRGFERRGQAGEALLDEQVQDKLRKALAAELPHLVQRELSDSHSLKLIIAYLEDLLSLLRPAGSSRMPLRAVADSSRGGYAPRSEALIAAGRPERRAARTLAAELRGAGALAGPAGIVLDPGMGRPQVLPRGRSRQPWRPSRTGGRGAQGHPRARRLSPKPHPDVANERAAPS